MKNGLSAPIETSGACLVRITRGASFLPDSLRGDWLRRRNVAQCASSKKDRRETRRGASNSAAVRGIAVASEPRSDGDGLVLPLVPNRIVGPENSIVLDEATKVPLSRKHAVW